MSKLNSNAIEEENRENLFSGLQRRDQIVATGQNIVSKLKQEVAVLNVTNPASQSSMQLQQAQYQPKE